MRGCEECAVSVDESIGVVDVRFRPNILVHVHRMQQRKNLISEVDLITCELFSNLDSPSCFSE